MSQQPQLRWRWEELPKGRIGDYDSVGRLRVLRGTTKGAAAGLTTASMATLTGDTGDIIFELCLGQAVHSCFPGLGPVHIGWWGRGSVQHTAREAGDLAFLQGLFTPVEFN